MDRNMMYAGTAIVMAGLLGFSWGKGGNGVRADDAKPVAGEIALVDIAKVFTAHKGMQGKSDELKREAERVSKDMQELQASGQKLQEQYNKAKKGSAEAKEVEQEIKKARDQFATLQQEQRRLLETNAEHLMATYEAINNEIARIAEARGYKLVLNFTLEPVVDVKDPQKRQVVLNRQVLYQNSLDITDDVISAFN
ncbi:MAG: OmpH family outer membrane protein [Planctomycetes bacterium]|nr:OmpH family outer membrane protein [Planctomycetota bacterium]